MGDIKEVFHVLSVESGEEITLKCFLEKQKAENVQVTTG
jgi:hypothetical protein